MLVDSGSGGNRHLLTFEGCARAGADSFYPLMGASCIITLLLLAFVNAGLLGTAVSMLGAAAIGLALGQSKSRGVEFRGLAE